MSEQICDIFPNTPSAFSPWLTTHCPAPLLSFHHSWHHPRTCTRPSINSAAMAPSVLQRLRQQPVASFVPGSPGSWQDPISRKRLRKHFPKKNGVLLDCHAYISPLCLLEFFPLENLEGKPLKATILHHTQPTFCEFIHIEKYIPHSQLGIFMV